MVMASLQILLKLRLLCRRQHGMYFALYLRRRKPLRLCLLEDLRELLLLIWGEIEVRERIGGLSNRVWQRCKRVCSTRCKDARAGNPGDITHRYDLQRMRARLRAVPY